MKRKRPIKAVKKRLLSAAIVSAMFCMLSACNPETPTGPKPTGATWATPPADLIASTSAEPAASVTAENPETAPADPAATLAETPADPPAPEGDPDEDAEGNIFPLVLLQRYTDVGAVEYIELSADFKAYTPGMVEMNDAIIENVGIRLYGAVDILEEPENKPEITFEDGGIYAYAYSITDENYIQVYNTILEYPAYGTSGELFGFVYDIKNDDYVTLDEFLETIGDNRDDLTFAMTEHYAASNPGVTFGTVDLRTFLLSPGPDGDYLYSFLFEMEITPPEADEPYKSFYIYTPQNGEVWEMNGEQLFDPADVDAYDTPLHCQEGWSSHFGF
jgi:hypothetical protein